MPHGMKRNLMMLCQTTPEFRKSFIFYFSSPEKIKLEQMQNVCINPLNSSG
jgi:hypothetical protein